jgi:predicted RNA binding protein YcfA (HicA-like mRNA interferase family)
VKQLSGRELVAVLRRHGWRLDRVRGSHHVMVKPGRAESLHGGAPVKPGRLLTVLRMAGIDRSAL